MVAPKKIIMGRGESAVSIGRARSIARKPVVKVKPKTKTKVEEPKSNVKVIEKPKWDSDGRPLNLAARKELNKAIKNSAIARQNTLKAKRPPISGIKKAVKPSTKGK